MARTRWGVAAIAVAGAAANAEPLQDVSVTATPLGDTPLQSSQPVSVLRGAELDRRRGASLGETLDRLPGVHSSGFGTAASRPVIRGFSGPRVGIKENGLDTMDASALSPDHAVAVDPLEARQIEVLRGPATLLYGSGAIGGLVNSVSDRIPTSPQTGLRGDALLGLDSASRERLGSVRLRGGVQPGTRAADGAAPTKPAGGSLNWTLGAFDRDAKDYAIPGTAVRGDPTSASGRLPNSFAESRGLSGGVSWTDRWGAAGVSHSGIDSRYGIPSEDGVFIDLRNRRTEGLVELDAPLPGLETLRLRTADVRYRHREIEGASGEVGTAFDSRGRDTRLDAVHLPVLGVRGALGLHSRQRDLTVSGEEAYVPSTRERENALFWVGERAVGPGRLEFGFRQGRATRTPDAASGFEERRFDLTSYSLGGVVPVFGPIALSVSAGSSQRAPAIEELYANGPHAATRTFEIGDAALGKERSRNIEIALRQATGPLRWKAGAYRQRFSSYVAGFATDDDGDGVADRVDETNAIANSAADPSAGDLHRLRARGRLAAGRLAVDAARQRRQRARHGRGLRRRAAHAAAADRPRRRLRGRSVGRLRLGDASLGADAHRTARDRDAGLHPGRRGSLVRLVARRRPARDAVRAGSQPAQRGHPPRDLVRPRRGADARPLGLGGAAPADVSAGARRTRARPARRLSGSRPARLR
jgi:iron complex outermembrane receptor protein